MARRARKPLSGRPDPLPRDDLSIIAMPMRQAFISRAPLIADRRLWTPNLLRPALTVYSKPARYKAAPSKGRTYDARQNVPIRIGFQAPKRVAICVRRKVRKHVLHALGVAGGRVRKPRRNSHSDIRC